MDLSKAVFIGTCVVTALGASFGAGLYAAHYRTPAYELIRSIKNAVEESLDAIEETSILVPEHFLQPARGAGAGVTVNERQDDGSLIFLSGFFEDSNELRLIRRDGAIVARWPVSFSGLFPETDHVRLPYKWRASSPVTDWNIDLHGALIQPDGSVVFNFSYGGLVKLDRCGGTIWTLAHMTHHSVEQADDGSYWVPGRRHVEAGDSSFRPFTTPYDEDLVLHVSPDGEIRSAVSVPAILYDNGLEAIFTASGVRFYRDFNWDQELVHLNKITVLTSDLAPSFPTFEVGDLMLSLRTLNLVFVYSPATGRIKWWQVGPWLRQHDPEFNSDGTITVFNNNAYATGLLEDGKSDPAAPRTSNILRIDPGSREAKVAFGGRPGQKMLSFLRGKHDVTASAGFLITVPEAGRVFETDSGGNIVWEYINRYDADNVAEITEARIYRADYFAVMDWACPPAAR